MEDEEEDVDDELDEDDELEEDVDDELDEDDELEEDVDDEDDVDELDEEDDELDDEDVVEEDVVVEEFLRFWEQLISTKDQLMRRVRVKMCWIFKATATSLLKIWIF